MIIYYNPECSKCREALTLLEENQCKVEIRNYLIDPPSEEEITELLKKLEIGAIDLVRKAEPLFMEKYAANDHTNEEWIKILSKNPELIERPIIIDGERAIIGRPPALVIEFVQNL